MAESDQDAETRERKRDKINDFLYASRAPAPGSPH